MSESLDEHERHEHGNLSRDCMAFTPEQLALRAMVDAIGSVVVINGIDESFEIIETSE